MFAWLIIVGSGYDDWVYWHFITITINCNSSHIDLLLNDICLLNLYEDSLTALESELESLHDWRFTANQFVLATIPLGLRPEFFFLNWTLAVVVRIWLPLWREDGSVIYNGCWPSPAHSHLGLVTIFYFLKFEISLFVTFYDSQCDGGGIRPRLHTGTTLEFMNAPHFITATRSR
jgi:hypothetical protein